MTTPNLFLVAAPRTGSTQLAHWLASHPDVSLSLVKVLGATGGLSTSAIVHTIPSKTLADKPPVAPGG